MILVCALLFSCATNDGAASGAAGGKPAVVDGQILGPDDRPYLALDLENDPIIGKWAAKYTFAQNPTFFGAPLITDNAAFGNIPEDIKARKTAAEELERQNRFLDAWKAYGEDDNEYIVAIKIMSLIEDWSDTMMHQMFVLSNLEPDQDLYEYRESANQTGEKIFYDPVEQAEKWAAANGGVMPPIIELALGCYYQDAALTFGDEWIMTQEDAYELSVEYFKKAIVAGVYNDYSLFKAVDSFLSAGYFNDGLEILHCLELGEPDYSFHFYQEARAYMCKGEYQNAMPCAARSIIYGTYVEDIAASAQVLADAFMYDSTDSESALAVLDAVKPYIGETYFMGPVFMSLDILMYAKNRYPAAGYDERIMSELTDAFAWEYSDGDYLYELTDYFYNYGFIDLGIKWLNSIMQEYAREPLAYGNLNFELGQLYMQIADYQNALDCFNAAETNLKAAGAFYPETSNIPYYQKQCREQLIGSPKKNKA